MEHCGEAGSGWDVGGGRAAVSRSGVGKFPIAGWPVRGMLRMWTGSR